ncbi:AsmA-like C-terminal region-containing protein [Rhizobium calliandrae]|uniref:AsmA-like C-terminal region-containing protein n=1 Tax=Rhizobium calliandrae TaxID=1312182 RepID=A0ABT7KHN9_9HYPH|nr:AsmA-like C-terminal region-containing protein [Rhizobium calliandrae]MDL2407510.1 AsmA-like C-terminal region-containing protein [Rhizobium calliandrae]
MRASRNNKWWLTMRSASRWLPTVARTTGIALFTIIVIFAVFRATAPFLISSGLVRSGIEKALSDWTGYRAQIEGAPTLEFWPTPRVTLNQVTIREPTKNGKVLGHVDSLSADFSLFAALRGRAHFHEFHFLRPVIYIRRDETGLIDWTNEGLLSKAIERVEQSSNQNTTMSKEEDAAIGTLTIEDGSVEMTDDRSGNLYKLGGVNADISWPRLSRPMTAVILARLNGQDVKIDFNSAQPLLLFAGKRVDAKTSFSSPLISWTYTGATSISNIAALTGNLDLSVPNMPAFLAWSGQHLPAASTLRNVSLNADVATIPNGLRFNNLSFKVNDAAASGVMDLSYSKAGKPKISGTLAFDQMNLNPFLAAFSMRLAADTAIDALLNGNPLQRLDVDMRLSSNKAVLGPFQFDDIGASLLVAGGSAKFDIGDSGFEGGELTSHLEVTQGDFDAGGKLQISIRNADFGGLFTRLNLMGPLPLTRGSLDLSLSTSKPIWAASLSDVAGKMHFTSATGSFRQFNISTFRALASSKAFFRMSDIADTAFDFDSLDVEASVAKGSVEVHDAKIEGRNETVVLNGVVPFRSNGLALSGTMQASDPANAAELPTLPFYIGGTWPDPVISPVKTLLQKSDKQPQQQ